MKAAANKGGKGCTICTHPEVEAIDAAVVAGTPMRVVAKQWKVSYASLQRHTVNHGRTGLVKVTPVFVPGEAGGDTAAKLESLLTAVENILATPGSHTQALDAIREARQLVVAAGAWSMEQERMSLLRRPSGTVNLLKSEQFIGMRTTIMRGADVFCRVTNSGVPNAPDVPVYPECYAAWKRIEAAFEEDNQ